MAILNLIKDFRKLIRDLEIRLTLNLPFMRRGMEAAADLPPHVILRLMREKFESFSDGDLSHGLKMLKSPESKAERETMAYLAGLGILDNIKEAAEQEIFLREHRRKYHEEKSG